MFLESGIGISIQTSINRSNHLVRSILVEIERSQAIVAWSLWVGSRVEKGKTRRKVADIPGSALGGNGKSASGSKHLEPTYLPLYHTYLTKRSVRHNIQYRSIHI